MQPNALLIRQNFIIAKSGCYISGSFILCMVTPLNFAHLDDLTTRHSPNHRPDQAIPSVSPLPELISTS